MSIAAKGLIRGHNAGAMAAFERAAVGQERRRGFYSFLTWPFLLGIAFASDDIAALTHTGGPQDDGPSSHPADDPQSPPADASIDPVALSDWEPGGPQQISQELLPGPHFPDAITF